jgi:TldD protein
MPFTRRDFLKSCAAGVATLGAARLPAAAPLPLGGEARAAVPSAGAPDSVFRPLTDAALETATTLGATYADIRIARYREQTAYLRTQAEFGTTKIQHVPNVSDTESFGFGIRVLVNGKWGFAAGHPFLVHSIPPAR